MDNLTPEQRRKNMQAIKSKGTSIELLLARRMWAEGIRYRKNTASVIGRPDFTIKKYKIAIFCDSEFFHGKDWETQKERIKSNREYWIPKIENNMLRDSKVNYELGMQGWTVIRFWGKDIKNDMEGCIKIIKSYIILAQIRNGSKGDTF